MCHYFKSFIFVILLLDLEEILYPEKYCNSLENPEMMKRVPKNLEALLRVRIAMKEKGVIS